MRNPVLVTALVASLSGCTSPPKTTQIPADTWVDEQIAQSATAISLAQRQLHQTSASPPPVAVANKTSPAPSAAITTPRPAAPPLQTSSAPPTVIPQGKAPVTVDTSTQLAKPAVPIAALPKAAPTPTTTSTKDFVAVPAKAPAAVVASAVSTAKPPATPVTPPAPPPPLPAWTASVGSTLHKSVAEWCERAKVKLIWKPEDLDYPIEAPLVFRGTFQQAIAQLFPLYDSAPRSFIVDGNSSQGILNVSERKK